MQPNKLRASIAPEQILEHISAIALRIYQSLDLDEILNTSVAEVRQLLQTDRVLIYRLNSDGTGVVAVESVGDGWCSIKGQLISDTCLQNNWVEPYTQGRVRAIADIYTANIESCHINFLAQFQVRANLVVPILQNAQTTPGGQVDTTPTNSQLKTHLWGLLIAHHCAGTRQWDSSEMDLLQKLTTHVAIAIQKAQLYQQTQIELAERQRTQVALQRLNEELETMVLDRTAELRDTNQQLQAEIAERLQVQRGLQESQFCSRLLNTISTGRTAGKDTEEIIDSTLKQIHQFFRSLSVTYCTIDQQNQLKVSQAIQPPNMPPCTGAIIDLTKVPKYLNNLHLGIPVIIENVTQAPILISLQHLIQTSQIRALLAVPLRYSDKLVGVISLNSSQVHRWSEYEIGTFVEIADYLSLTLQEAQVQQEHNQALLDLQAQAQLLNLAHDTIMVQDVNNRIMFWNQGAVEMYGYEQEEAIGQNATILLQSQFPGALEEIEDQLQRSGYWEGEIIQTKRDRSRVVVASRWALIRDENGTPVKILEINNDITKRVQAEQELRESETFIRALYQVATNPQLSLSDRFENVLAMGCQHFDLNYSFLAKVEGDRFETLAVQTPDKSAAVGDVYDVRQTFCLETLQQEEMLWIQHASASDRWRNHPGFAKNQMETYIGMRILVNNKVYGVLCFYSKVPQLRQIRSVDKELLKLMSQWIGIEIERDLAAQTLEQLRHQNELILNSAGEGICGVDLQGNITFVNPAAAKMLGYKVAELINQPIQNTLLQPKSDGTSLTLEETFLHTVIKKGTLQQFKDQVFWRSDGSSFPVECIATPMIDRLHLQKLRFYSSSKKIPTIPVGAVITFRDITERQAIERMKDEFISVVSHELRTPLTSIRGALGLVAGGLLTTQPQKAQRMLEIAASNTDRLTRLINDILDIERIESGKVQMEKEECNASELMMQAADDMRAMAEKAGVTLAVASVVEMQGQPPVVWADRDRIIQVFTNLISNALKFSPPNTTIEVAAELQIAGKNQTSFSANSKQILFQVKDQGRGIPADKLESIFERFQQVNSSDSRDRGGTGLGLAICRTIVQQHEGCIWVESRLGEGSTFYFTLPALPATPTSDVEEFLTQHALRATQTTPNTQNAPLVLLCDDDTLIHPVIEIMLEDQGYQVVAVASGAEAIKLAALLQPAVILLDLLMPKMNGWDTMAALKEQPLTKNIPIIIFSALLPEYESSDPKASGWLAKPVIQASLVETIKQSLKQRSQVTRILVVEEDVDLAQVLMMMFEYHGIEAYHAQTEEQAIQMSQTLHPNLLLLDLVLPQGNGSTVVEWLRQHDHLRHVPLVVYSAQELNKAERDRLLLGPTEFFTKGQITPQDFEQRVIALLNRIVGDNSHH